MIDVIEEQIKSIKLFHISLLYPLDKSLDINSNIAESMIAIIDDAASVYASFLPY